MREHHIEISEGGCIGSNGGGEKKTGQRWVPQTQLSPQLTVILSSGEGVSPKDEKGRINTPAWVVSTYCGWTQGQSLQGQRLNTKMQQLTITRQNTKSPLFTIPELAEVIAEKVSGYGAHFCSPKNWRNRNTSPWVADSHCGQSQWQT